MISAVIVFVVVFAAMGLLLGYATTYHVVPEHRPQFQANDTLNSTKIAIEESVQVTVDRSPAQ